ncbi:MAG: Holliday junction resolvase RuvX [Chloroflexi bacterium]|nr:Holliday junction resolvase RuvX [Chloroflexota bacterium]
MDADFGRVLAVDPGEKRLGIAVSDPTRTIATPLSVINHISRKENALAILNLALEQEVTLIIIGQPRHWDDSLGAQAEKSNRLAEEIRSQGTIPVQLWNEYGSTQAALSARRQMNVSRKKRIGHLDDLAAAIILQNFLNSTIDEEYE